MCKNFWIILRYIAISATFLSLSANAISSVQTEKKRVLSETGLIADRQSPFEVSEVKAGSRDLTLGQPFSAGEDWFRDLTITLKNISDKSISFIEVDLFFSETVEAQREAAGLMLRYGVMLSAPGTPQQRTAVRYITPGETVDLKLSEEEYGQVQSRLNRDGVHRSVGSVKLLVRAICFEGNCDEMWGHGGYLMKRDEQDPKSYKPAGLYVLPKKPE